MRRRIVAAAATAGISAVAGAYEEPGYRVEQTFEGFELRSYAAYVVIETAVDGDFETARNEAFRRLFAYISGENVAAEEVAMTVPVTTSERPPGEKVAMTVPVTTESAAAAHVMQFMLPAKYTFESAPRPRDPRVRIRQIGPRLVAARRFSGRASEANYRDEERELLERLPAARVRATSRPSFAVYNGPFTPWFLRRNEVLVPVERISS